MKPFLVLFSLSLLTLASCTDPITVGSDILAGDRAEVGQVSDFPFTTNVVRDDSLLVFRASSGLPVIPSFSVGQTTDPVFGKWTNSVSITPGLLRNSITRLVTLPEFVTDANTDVDSIVLILPLDTTGGFYGLGRTFPVQLTRLSQPVETTEDIYSNAPRPLTGENLFDGSEVTISAARRPLYDTIYAQGTSIDSIPHIRLKLTQSFVDEINMLDSTAFKTDTFFRTIFAGVYLEPIGDAGGFVKIRPRPATTGTAVLSGFYFFYPDPSTNDPASFYQAPFQNWFVRYEQDYSGSLAESLLGPEPDDTEILVGGTASLMTAITFTDLDALRSSLINRTELTFFRKALDGYDYDEFGAASYLALYYRNNAGALVPILDAGPGGETSIFNNIPIQQFLGGFAEMNDTDTFYRNRLSIHLQGILNGDFAEPVVYLRAFPNFNNPARVILGGPGATENPAEANVTFTRIE